MSVKHVKDYYQQVCEQYNEMLENIQDAEKDLEENVVSLDYVENLKTIIAPIKDNYERWCYMMYLLNKPNKKKKQKKYETQNKSLMNSLAQENSIDSTLKQSEQAIKNIKKNT